MLTTFIQLPRQRNNILITINLEKGDMSVHHSSWNLYTCISKEEEQYILKSSTGIKGRIQTQYRTSINDISQL